MNFLYVINADFNLYILKYVNSLLEWRNLLPRDIFVEKIDFKSKYNILLFIIVWVRFSFGGMNYYHFLALCY